MIAVLFSGLDGWGEGMRMVAPDLHAEMVGYELDRWAVATARAAGHQVVHGDLTAVDVGALGPLDGVVASPPCPTFSSAGHGHGVKVTGELAAMITDALRGAGARAAAGHRAVMAEALTAALIEHAGDAYDRTAAAVYDAAGHYGIARSIAQTLDDVATAPQRAAETVEGAALTAEPARWIAATRPRWVAMEQVPAVLPLWKVYVAELQRMGYSAWCGILNAADYGVPQTRKRAILLASRDRQVTCPDPTHAQDPTPTLFGEPEPWVTMAQALGWDGMLDRRQQTNGVPVRQIPTDEPAPTVTGTAGARGQWVLRGHHKVSGQHPPATRDAGEPALTVDSRADLWARENPAPTVTGGGTGTGGGVEVFGYSGTRRKIAASWPFERPATTVVGSFSPDVIAAPGYRSTGDGPRQKAPGSVSVSVSEVLVLQSFPATYPLQGPRSAQFLQVGNAMPPRLAAHAFAAVTGRPAGSLLGDRLEAVG